LGDKESYAKIDTRQGDRRGVEVTTLRPKKGALEAETKRPAATTKKGKKSYNAFAQKSERHSEGAASEETKPTARLQRGTNRHMKLCIVPGGLAAEYGQKRGHRNKEGRGNVVRKNRKRIEKHKGAERGENLGGSGCSRAEDRGYLFQLVRRPSQENAWKEQFRNGFDVDGG